MQIKPAIRLTEVKPCQSLGMVKGDDVGIF